MYILFTEKSNFIKFDQIYKQYSLHPKIVDVLGLCTDANVVKGQRACSLVGAGAGLDWLVLIFCERKTLLAGWFGLAETNKRTGWKYPYEKKRERQKHRCIGKRESCIGKEKCALKSEKVKYFGTKFEWYKVNYSMTAGVHYYL